MLNNSNLYYSIVFKVISIYLPLVFIIYKSIKIDILLSLCPQ